MKPRLGRPALIAAGAVAASLFVLLCMVFYGREDFLAPERILARSDALRFRIASAVVEPFGAGAYLAFGLLFVWSVVAYFRGTVGAVLPRAVGMLACIPSFCALTSLTAGPREFWAGSVGVWAGDIASRGFGHGLGLAVLGTLFLVSFALATEFGFHGQLAALRGTLAFPLLPPEEPAAPAPAEASLAVLDPVADANAVDPADAWKQGTPAESFEVPEPVDEPGDVRLLDRADHLADVRRRLDAGEPVTEAERALLHEAKEQSEMASAIDALFAKDAPAAPAPAVLDSPAPVAPAEPAASVPDLPPFLLDPNSSHPLLGQEIAPERPFPAPAPVALGAVPVSPMDALLPPPPAPAAETPAAEPPASHAREISAEDIAAATRETEEFPVVRAAEVLPEFVSTRARDIFANVEFMAPSEELADPVVPPPPPEPVDEVAAVPESPVAALLAAPTSEPPPVPPAPPAPSAADAAAEAASLSGAAEPVDFEDEFFSFGIEEPAAPAPEVVDEPRDASGGEWLAVAAQDLGLDPVAEEPPAPPVDPATEALNRLFGEPVVREESTPPGPSQSEPREPPANLAPEAGMPVLPEAAGEVTLIQREPVTDCLDDHGIVLDLGEQVYVPQREIVDESPAPVEAAAPEAAAPLTDAPPAATIPDAHAEHSRASSILSVPVEEAPAPVETPAPVEEPTPVEEPETPPVDLEQAADAIVHSLDFLFGEPAEPAVEPAVEAAPEEPVKEPEALNAHGWGTLYPNMIEEPAPVAETPVVETPVVEEAPVEALLAAPQEIAEEPEASRVPVHGPPPAEPPAEASEILNEAPAEAEVPIVDESLVNSLVDEFRAEAPAEPQVEEPVEVAPAPVLPAPAAEPAVPGVRDELYDQAIEAVRERGRGSVVVLQRRLGIGFTRATKILESLVANGVLGAENASGSHPLL